MSHQADTEPAARYSWDGQEQVINLILEGVQQEIPEIAQIPEHECRRELRIRISQDPRRPGPEHELTACEICLYGKMMMAGYLVLEEAHGSATLEWMP